MKRYRLSKKDIAKIEERFSAVSLKLPEALDYYEKDDTILYLHQDKPLLFVKDGEVYPTLHALPFLDKTKAPLIKVDRGAIPFVIKGADVMRPGIIFMSENVAKDRWLVIQDPEHGKDLAIGKALYNSLEMKELQKGKVVLALHYFGDKLWTFEP